MQGTHMPLAKPEKENGQRTNGWELTYQPIHVSQINSVVTDQRPALILCLLGVCVPLNQHASTLPESQPHWISWSQWYTNSPGYPFDPSPPLKHWGNVHRHKTWRSSGNLTNLTYNKGWEVSKHSLKGRNRDWYPQRLHWQLQLVPVSRGGPATRRDALQRKQRAPWKVPLAWPKGFTKIYLFYWICPPL